MNKLAISLLDSLFHFPSHRLLVIFLIENAFIVFLVLLAGRVIQRVYLPNAVPYFYTIREYVICSVTTVLNTVVTFCGFWLWKNKWVEFQVSVSFFILIDFVLVFLAMDFLMYVFHFFIHKTPLHKAMHQLHHQSIEPKPIDLFVLHPVETICFGTLWIGLLLVYPFNFYSIVAYLIVNVIFGMVGHLGWEPLPDKMRFHFLFKFIGTSTFHHQHHQSMNHNFGFYTNIWDRLFGTLK